MADKKIPLSVSDTLLHTKTDEGKELVVLPFTRYGNVLNAPKVVTDPRSMNGAPFGLLVSDTEVLTTEQLRALDANII